MTITLTPDIEKALASEANRKGTTPETLALDCLRSRFLAESVDDSTPPKGSLAEFLADRIGVIDSGQIVDGGARMSEKTGRDFAEGLLKKKQQGRL
jgi:hypothetical protein